ncbi:MAG TPA: carboxypeptidase-like regulatory domain-containing protein [Terriglobia bacterium]
MTPLPVGSYTIKFTKEGFKPTAINNVELEYGQTRTFDVKLEVGALQEGVSVTATAESVNRTNAEVSGVIESAQIKEIPVSGRNWASLMLRAPGAINYGDGAQRSIRFSGHSLDDSNFTFDGVDTSGVQEQTQKADTRLNIALDAIQEFRVSTSNYTAESGAAGGAQINVVSKAGTNQFHGDGFYALRNDALDSRSPFDGATLPSFTLNQFGASLGGPVVKNKAFFYLNYEGLRQSLGETLTNFVPNAAFRAQVLATSPALASILKAYPMGQTPIPNSVTDQITEVTTDPVRCPQPPLSPAAISACRSPSCLDCPRGSRAAWTKTATLPRSLFPLGSGSPTPRHSTLLTRATARWFPLQSTETWQMRRLLQLPACKNGFSIR